MERVSGGWPCPGRRIARASSKSPNIISVIGVLK
jgi:hypothetical protein